MEKASTETFKELLGDMLGQVEGEANLTVNDMRGEAIPFPDPTDRATLEAERNLTLRIRDRERKLKSKIEEALVRIEMGTFGTCEVCEEEISESRLKARPVTTLCINCKSEQEEDEDRH